MAQTPKKPAYSLFVVPSKYNVNVNEEIAFRVGVSGNGPLKELKVLLYVERIDARSKGKTTNTLLRFDGEDWNNSSTFWLASDKKLLQNLKTKADVTTTVFISKEEINDSSNALGIYKLVLAKPQSEGDKVIQMILTYSPDRYVWYQDKKEFKFHANTWLEKNWVAVLFISIAGLFLTVLGYITNICAWLGVCSA